MRAVEQATGLAGDPLWDFALEVYGAPGVAETCLALQDEHGADVNLLLYALWCGARLGRQLSPGEAETARLAVAGWAEAVVGPLRAVRRAMKTPIGTVAEAPRLRLRDEIKRIELAAERVQLAALFALAGSPPGGPRPPATDASARALHNLRLVLPATAAGETAAFRRLVAVAVPHGRPA